jgi:hypothetical protein
LAGRDSLLTDGELLDGVLWGQNPQEDRAQLVAEIVTSRIGIVPVTRGTLVTRNIRHFNRVPELHV